MKKIICKGHNLNRCNSVAKTHKYSTTLALRIFVANSQSGNIATYPSKKDSGYYTHPIRILFPAYTRLATAFAPDQLDYFSTVLQPPWLVVHPRLVTVALSAGFLFQRPCRMDSEQ